MVLTYRGQPAAVHWGRYPYHYSGFYSQSGDCWGMIGSIIALLLTGHFILPIALVYGAAFWARSAKQRVSKTRSRNRWIPSWIRPISLGNRKIDSMCEKMNPELESGLKEQMTQKREAFEELIGKVGQS